MSSHEPLLSGLRQPREAGLLTLAQRCFAAKFATVNRVAFALTMLFLLAPACGDSDGNGNEVGSEVTGTTANSETGMEETGGDLSFESEFYPVLTDTEALAVESLAWSVQGEMEDRQ